MKRANRKMSYKVTWICGKEVSFSSPKRFSTKEAAIDFAEEVNKGSAYPSDFAVFEVRKLI